MYELSILFLSANFFSGSERLTELFSLIFLFFEESLIFLGSGFDFLIEISDKTFNLNESKEKSFHRILNFADIVIKFAKGGVHSED
nr:hypothetical protein [Candidatus Dependentiae bacterium]